MSSFKHGRYSRRGFLAAALAALAPAAFAQCRRTPSDALGPYYFPVSGTHADLCQRDSSSGIVVAGRVLAFPECQPVSGATIEIWHADARGVYSRLGTVPADDLACMLRGNVRSTDGGRYTFRTVPPGLYTGRPRHIHMRVTAPGYRTLETQMYFPPQEGVDARLLAKPAKPSATGAATFEFDLAIAPL